MTSTSADNMGSSTDMNGVSEKIEGTQDVENGDEGQASVNNTAADISDNDDGKIVYVAFLFCLY